MEEASVVDAQLRACFETYVSLSTHLAAAAADGAVSPALLESKISMLKLIATLNTHRSNVSADLGCSYVGCVVMAPRVFDRAMGLALVERIDADPDGDKHCCVRWIRPSSVYEVGGGSGKIPFGRIERAELEPLLSSTIRAAAVGDRVIAQNDRGLWKPGCIASIDEAEDNSSVAMVRFDDSTSMRLPCNPFHMAPHPRPDSENSGDSSDSDSSEVEGCTTLPASRFEVLNQTVNGSAQGLSELVKVGHCLGEWEKHTKGFGGKLLARMGYKRGGGLGARENGITIPIKSCAVLPERVSLDFIHEYSSDRRDISEGSIALHYEEGGRGRKRRRKARKRAHVNEKFQNSSVFDFLNNTVVEGIEDGALHSMMRGGGAAHRAYGRDSSKDSVQYIDRVANMKSGKQIADSLGLDNFTDLKRSTATDDRAVAKLAAGRAADRVAVSSSSRLMALEDKEKEIIVQIKKYREGLSRNESKDQKAASAIADRLRLAEQELAALRAERGAVSAFKEHNSQKHRANKSIKKIF